MRGDAVIVTGSVTGDPPRVEDIVEVKQHCRLPVYLGSGVTAENLATFYDAADGFIVGSYFKANGRWNNTVEPKRVKRFMAAHAKLSR